MLTPTRRRQRASRAPAAGAAAAALVLVVALAGSAIVGSDDEDGRGAAQPRDPLAAEAADLAADMARPFPEVQRDNGYYRSSTGGGTRYGAAMLGYALIETGLRTDDPRLVTSALRGIRHALRTTGAHSRPSQFENFALAGAYNLVRRHYAGEPVFREIRGRWEEFLRQVRIDRLPAEGYYGNHWLVEALTVQELLRSGLRSSDPHAVLGPGRGHARRLAARLVNVRLPAMARERGVRAGGRRTFVLSDAPDDPLAYQGLSLGLYARGIRMLGRRASLDARRTLREIANASTWLTGPDGDVAFTGRNQEQIWALGATAYGSAVAAADPRSPRADDARYRALSARTLQRVRSHHRIGHFGAAIIPAAARDRTASPRALDGGAGGPSFAGLAQLFIEWSIPELERTRRVRPGEIRADRPGAAVLNPGPGGVATARSGSVWYAVRQQPSGKHPYDLRYDFGLIAMKVRGEDGKWEDGMPIRPITLGKPDSAGPLMGTTPPGLPFADRMSVTRGGAVTLEGGFRGPPSPFKRIVTTLPSGVIVRALGSRPGPVARAGVRFRLEPTRCGVAMEYPVAAGDRVEQSFFFRRRPRVGPRRVADGRTSVSFDRPARVSLDARTYASGTDARLVRARLAFAAERPDRIAVTVEAPCRPS